MDHISIISINDLDHSIGYLIPNERYTEAFSEVLAPCTNGLLISVGTIRSLIDASIGHFDQVIIMDNNISVMTFNRLNLELMIEIDMLPLSIKEKRIQYFSVFYGRWLTDKQLKLICSYDQNRIFDERFLLHYRELFKCDNSPSVFPDHILEIIQKINKISKINNMIDFEHPSVPGIPSNYDMYLILDPYYHFSYSINNPIVSEYLKDKGIKEYQLRSTYNPERHSFYFENDDVWIKIIDLIKQHKIHLILSSIYVIDTWNYIQKFIELNNISLKIIDLSNILDHLSDDLFIKEDVIKVQTLIQGLTLLQDNLKETDMIKILQTKTNYDLQLSNAHCRDLWCYEWYSIEKFIKNLLNLLNL